MRVKSNQSVVEIVRSYRRQFEEDAGKADHAHRIIRLFDRRIVQEAVA